MDKSWPVDNLWITFADPASFCPFGVKSLILLAFLVSNKKNKKRLTFGSVEAILML